MYRKAADQGGAQAQCNVGFTYDQGQGVKQDDAEAVRLFKKTADQANAQAQFNLGNKHFTGQGVDQDYGEALRWYHKAAAQGHDGAKQWELRAKEILRVQRQVVPANQTFSSNTCANCGVAEVAGGGALKPCGELELWTLYIASG